MTLGTAAWSIDGISAFLNGLPGAASQRIYEGDADVPPIQELLATIPQGGTWTVNAASWQISAAFRPAGEELTINDTDALADSSASLESAETHLLHVLQRIARRTAGPRGAGFFELRRPDVRFAAATKIVDGTERICLARAAIGLDDRRELFVEARPIQGPGSPRRQQDEPTGLLGLSTICSYISARNEVILQIGSTRETVEEFASRWRNSGWDVTFDSSDDSALKELACRRRGKAVRVGIWSRIEARESYFVVLNAQSI